MQKKDNTPDFSVKLGDGGGFVGSAWKNSSKYGDYITVVVNESVQAGSKLFLSPRREVTRDIVIAVG